MKKWNYKFVTVSLSILLVLGACEDLGEMNINPNAPDPESTDLNLLLPTILTSLGGNVVNLGFGDLAGVMQHTQKTGWSSGHNSYDWNNPGQSWNSYYGILRNANEFYEKAVNGGYEHHEGVGLVLKAYTFGLIADLWGDAPYSQALKGDEGLYKPVFDSQQDIYHNILDDLEMANTLLSSTSNLPINGTQDILYQGDASKWRKFANSLALRYYMRLQAKESSFAQTGINKIASDPATYPVITSSSNDANVGYAGTAANTSWPTTMVYNPNDNSSEYLRRKPCATLVDTLQSLNDPRLGVWFEKVEIPLVLVSGTAIDRIIGFDENDNIVPEDDEEYEIKVVREIREISADIEAAEVAKWEDEPDFHLDYDTEYVGIPNSSFSAQAYNLTPNYVTQGAYNPHTSQLSLMYRGNSGDLLQMRLMSAAEVNFILAEAATYGWATGETAATYYANGIRESLNAWGVASAFDDYILEAPYVDLGSIIFQKWIASWTAATEAWFDYRRTGMPDLKTGPSARRTVLPLRFYYSVDEDLSTNEENAEAALESLEPTSYLGTDPTKNSAWSKPWLLQGTGLPY